MKEKRNPGPPKKSPGQKNVDNQYTRDLLIFQIKNKTQIAHVQYADGASISEMDPITDT